MVDLEYLVDISNVNGKEIYFINGKQYQFNLEQRKFINS